MASITNQASVSFSYEGSENTQTNNSNVVSATMLDEYSIKVEKTATSTCYRPGDTLTYFVQVVNNGCGCLKNFTISDDLGTNGHLSYVDGSARVIADGILSEIVPTGTTTLDFLISDRLEHDDGFVLLYNVTVNSNLSEEVNELQNTVTVTGYSCGCKVEEERQSISATATATITKCDYAEVLITKQASSDTYCCDDEIDFFITLTNTGTVDATNVVVTDSLPENFTATAIHMENNGNHYEFSPSEYTINSANLLTLPNETGTAILVPALGAGTDNTTRIRIHGHL